jgi:esterase/lipase
MSKRLIRISSLIFVLVALYFLGPSPDRPEWNPTMPTVLSEPSKLEAYIAFNESQHKLKPNNEAQIVWVDSTKQKTEYAVIYLHGFSASQMEGDPVHRRFAKEFGCNLFLARLADHGIDTVEALLNFTSDRWWASAKEALAIGKQIGNKVIIMSTSTGGTMAVALAAQYPDDVYALINLSPNIELRDGAAFLLNNPWGLQIARTVIGGDYREWEADSERKKYWYNKYRIESLVQLEEMIESKMNKKTFQKIKQPCLTLYYYKNEEEQDPEVSVPAMLKMMDELGTPAELKRSVAMPKAGAHVLGSSIVSKDVEGVYKEIEDFSKNVLMMKAEQGI